jgi:hypothetical protein
VEQKIIYTLSTLSTFEKSGAKNNIHIIHFWKKWSKNIKGGAKIIKG